MTEGTERSLRVPARDLVEPRYFAASPEALGDWLGTVPLVNHGVAAPLLAAALEDLARLDVEPELRLELIEGVRGAVHTVARILDRRSPGAPLVVSREAEDRHTRAQRLHRWLAVAYEGVLADALPLPGQGARRETVKEVAVTALHRALTELGINLFRSLAAHKPMPQGIWRELHALYRVAEEQHFEDEEVVDATHRIRALTTVMEAYLRPLLLSCAEPYALGVQRLTGVFHALEDWSYFAELRPVTEIEDAPYCVDLGGAEPPRAGSYIEGAAEGNLRGIRSRPLADALKALISEERVHGQETAFAREGLPTPLLPSEIETALLRRLGDTWQGPKERHSRRVAVGGELDTAFGLAAAHYHVAGELSLQALVQGGSDLVGGTGNRFLEGRDRFTGDDPWSRAHDVVGTAFPEIPTVRNPGAAIAAHGGGPQRTEGGARAYPLHRCRVADKSAGGYGLAWPRERVPDGLCAGELLALREKEGEHWRASLVRWVRIEGKEVRAGVELLGPIGAAVGIRSAKPRSEPQEWIRALMLILPEGSEAAESRLLLPKVPVHRLQDLVLNQNGETSRVRLQRRVELSATLLMVQVLFLDTGHRAEPGSWHTMALDDSY